MLKPAQKEIDPSNTVKELRSWLVFLLFAANIKVFPWQSLGEQPGSAPKIIFKLLFETAPSSAPHRQGAVARVVWLFPLHVVRWITLTPLPFCRGGLERWGDMW